MTTEIEDEASRSWAMLTDAEQETRMFWDIAHEVRRSSAGDDDTLARQDIEELSSFALYTDSAGIRRAVFAGLRAALDAPNRMARLAAARAYVHLWEVELGLNAPPQMERYTPGG
jgi:hypothetical protein